MKKILIAEIVIASSLFSAWAEPGGTYTLTGEEKGIEEIIKADMAPYPALYKGVYLPSYLSEFKRKNKIGKRKFSPGDILYFPDTAASRKEKKDNAKGKELIKIGRIVFEGGDGSSIEKAVIVRNAKNSIEGVDAEAKWNQKVHPDWRKGSQACFGEDGRMYDQIEYTTPDNETKTIFFDITDFYGKF